jgi:hypothetical protein
MMKTWFLKAVLVVMAAVAVAVAFFALPSIYKCILEDWPIINTTLLLLFIVGLGVSAIPFLIALYQAFKLLNYIDKNTAFSETSVVALKNIKYCGIVISILYAVGIPFLFQVAELDDAPGLGLIALAFTCIPLVVSTFAAVLQKLFQNALDIKKENELTV